VSLPEEPWVTVALLGKTRGNRGEITAVAFSSKPERFQALREVFLFAPGQDAGERRAVESAWFHDGALIFKFQGIDSISDAERLNRAEVRIPASKRAPLEPGEFFQSDLIGCEVFDHRTGERLGRVTAWDDAGGPGLLVVDDDLLVPFARSICVEISPAEKRIVVKLPEGLKDLNQK
jgi:16S rRNA processing protein RimM